MARGMEASMQGHSHNLLNQSVAAGYRNGAKSSMGTERDLGESDKVSSILSQLMTVQSRHQCFELLLM